MNREVFDTIVQTVGEILIERQEPVPELTPETLISASGLDSLDIATLTVRLDGQIGRVPEEALRQYPQTLGELADLYARYRKLQPVSEAI
jgi:acyl carrier protein